MVLYDRLKSGTERSLVPRLLSYVMAHEITHILQGVARHSSTGIMKANWDRTDYFNMGANHLGFTKEDIHLIYLGLDTPQTGPTGE